MPKPISCLLIAGLGAAVVACDRSEPPAQADVAAASDAASAYAVAVPQPRVRLAIQLIAAQSAPEPRQAPSAAPSAQPAPPASGDPAADPPGFRITVPMCRRAERLDDPLAKTAECAQLLQAARDQAEACKKAFENGDDKSALSPACRQAAGFR